MKKYFFLKLIPPRPTFVQDMTEEERKIMKEHQVYWQGLTQKGYSVVYGPVLDPKGAYGVGIIVVDSDDQVNELISRDPANGLNFYEAYPMLAVLPEK
jgi:hypothetical protein